MSKRSGGPFDGAEAVARLSELIGRQNEKAHPAPMPVEVDIGSPIQQILYGDDDRISALFPASEYEDLCRHAAAANTLDRGTVSLVLPVMDTSLHPEMMESVAPLMRNGDTFMTLACADMSPHAAFLLVSGLTLYKSSRSALEDNGLSIRGLTMREAILTARRETARLSDD